MAWPRRSGCSPPRTSSSWSRRSGCVKRLWHDGPTKMRRLTLAMVLATATAATAACGTAPAPTHECATGADCASGVCRGDGTCAPDGDAGPNDGDAAPQHDGGVPGTCDPNHDGTITRAELTFAPNLHENDRIAASATFAT